jgi:hypothetical protein
MVSEHGIPGSSAWWEAIADGRISLRTVEGRIVRVYKTGLPSADWPEFEVDSNGERTFWNCAASGTPDERVAALRLFEAGRPVRIVYVLEPLERPVSGKQFVKTEVEIWIG